MEKRIKNRGGKYDEPFLAKLLNYELNFNKIPGYADIEPKKESIVYGYAYLMDKKAFLLMDLYEGNHENN